MDADAYAAAAAIAAVILSVISLIWQWRSAESRKEWEAEQIRTEYRLNQQLQEKQNEWDLELDSKQAERMAAWRAEDIQRKQDSITPQLRITVSIGEAFRDAESGRTTQHLYIDADNVGQTPILLSDWASVYADYGKPPRPERRILGEFTSIADRPTLRRVVHWPHSAYRRESREHDFNTALQPSQRVLTTLDVVELKQLVSDSYPVTITMKRYEEKWYVTSESLEDSQKPDVVPICGCYTDQIGLLYLSDSVNTHLNSDFEFSG